MSCKTNIMNEQVLSGYFSCFIQTWCSLRLKPERKKVLKPYTPKQHFLYGQKHNYLPKLTTCIAWTKPQSVLKCTWLKSSEQNHTSLKTVIYNTLNEWAKMSYAAYLTTCLFYCLPLMVPSDGVAWQTFPTIPACVVFVSSNRWFFTMYCSQLPCSCCFPSHIQCNEVIIKALGITVHASRYELSQKDCLYLFWTLIILYSPWLYIFTIHWWIILVVLLTFTINVYA